MWFGKAPAKSRAAPMERVATETEHVRARQRQILGEIRGFIDEEKARQELLSERLQEAVFAHRQQQELHDLMRPGLTTSSSPSSFAVDPSSRGGGRDGGVVGNAVVLPPMLVGMEAGGATRAAFSDDEQVEFDRQRQVQMRQQQVLQRQQLQQQQQYATHARQQQQNQQQRNATYTLTPSPPPPSGASALPPSMPVVTASALASGLSVEILTTCASVVHRIDAIMARDNELKDKMRNKSSNNATTTTVNATSSSAGASSQQQQQQARPRSSGGGDHQQQQQQPQQPDDLSLITSPDPLTTATSSNSRFAQRRAHAVTQLDVEELDEDLARIRNLCYEDAYLDDEACSVGPEGYGENPEPPDLGPVSSVVGSVETMRSCTEKVAACTEEMQQLLEGCISMRRDMITLRSFKRNMMRASYHGRKVLQWANSCRTHMFIFNNTINQVTRDAAGDLRTTSGAKVTAQERIDELQRKHEEMDELLVAAKAETRELNERHVEMQERLLAAYEATVQQKRNDAALEQQQQFSSGGGGGASPYSPTLGQSLAADLFGTSSASATLGASAAALTFNSSSSRAATPGGGAAASSPSPASPLTPRRGSAQPKKPKIVMNNTDTPAHRAFEKMHVTAVELYLLLDRYVSAISSDGPLAEKLSLAVRRVMAVIEQSVVDLQTERQKEALAKQLEEVQRQMQEQLEEQERRQKEEEDDDDDDHDGPDGDDVRESGVVAQMSPLQLQVQPSEQQEQEEGREHDADHSPLSAVAHEATAVFAPVNE